MSMKTSDFIWKVADLLQGDYKQSEYGDVILPFTVSRRRDEKAAAAEIKTGKRLQQDIL